MGNYKTNTENIKEGFAKIEEGMRLLSNGPSSFYLKKVENYITMLFERFCPYKIGDRVEITKAPKCEGGWAGSKHFLVVGAQATVLSVDAIDGLFCFELDFDNESYISIHEGKVIPIEKDNHHVYTFYETSIRKVESVNRDYEAYDNYQ